MPAATIRLATDADMRSITSQNVGDIMRLPFFYMPTEEPDIMRVWGVARVEKEGGENSVDQIERLYPGSLIAPHYAGERASRGDLLYHGAESAAAFLPNRQRD